MATTSFSYYSSDAVYTALLNELDNNKYKDISGYIQTTEKNNIYIYSDKDCNNKMMKVNPNTVIEINRIYQITPYNDKSVKNIVARVSLEDGKQGYILIAYGAAKSPTVNIGTPGVVVPTWLGTKFFKNAIITNNTTEHYLIESGKLNKYAISSSNSTDTPIGPSKPEEDTSQNSGTSGATTAAKIIEVANTELLGPFYPINWSERNSSNNISAFDKVIKDTFATGNLKSSVGLDLNKLRGIFGMPYQFLPSTDCRIGFADTNRAEENQTIGKFGTTYAEMVVSRMPLLYITPGNPNFMSTAGKARTSLISDFGSWFNTGDTDSLDNLMDGYSGKLYSIEPKYTEYFRYVNVMTRAGAILLGLKSGSELCTKYGEEYVKLHGVYLENYNWGTNFGGEYSSYEEPVEESEETAGADTTTTTEVTEPEEEISTSDPFSLSNQISEFQSYMYYKSAIPFYINSDSSYSETMSNETTESSLASTINGLSDKAREMQFLLGTASTTLIDAFDNATGSGSTLSAAKQEIEKIVNNLGNLGSNIFGSLANSVKTIVTGGRIMFPNIWANSNFSKQYNISIRLTTPYFDPRSWFLNIYVPLCHLIALVLPRGEYPNGYTTPFLIKAFYKGMFNIDMGIITDMSINKGKEGGWTKDALPTVVEVQFTIQDLYSQLSMSNDSTLYKGNTLQNIAEMDYLANLCGINIYQPDTFRMMEFWYTFNVSSKFTDIPYKISSKFEEGISNSINNMFSGF